jgi:membrane protease YdiL (CAAX protease family)
MEAKKITLKTLGVSIAAILLVEAVFNLVAPAKIVSPLAMLGFVRALEAVLLVVIILWLEKDTGAIGLTRSRIWQGLKKGLIWSAGFGIFVGGVYLVLLTAKIDVIKIIRRPPGTSPKPLLVFLLVGGVIGPIAEEIFFRGIIYGFFRRWGIVVAVILSTIVFVFIHPYSVNLPLTQTVGGIIFAVAYEKEQNLMVPITIHCLGNLAIFSLTIFL